MNVINILAGVVVLVAVVASQLRTQPVTARRLRIAGVLGVVGVIQIHGALDGHPVSAAAGAILVVGLLVGAGLGVWRAYTMPLWDRDGTLYTRGTWATAALWLAGAAVDAGLHLVVHAVAPAADALGSVSTLLLIAVSLGAQALMLLQRARTEHPSMAPAVRVRS